jgi:hypothetical protein
MFIRYIYNTSTLIFVLRTRTHIRCTYNTRITNAPLPSSYRAGYEILTGCPFSRRAHVVPNRVRTCTYEATPRQAMTTIRDIMYTRSIVETDRHQPSRHRVSPCPCVRAACACPVMRCAVRVVRDGIQLGEFTYYYCCLTADVQARRRLDIICQTALRNVSMKLTPLP